MKYKHILITGGAGFVGSNTAIKLKEKYPKSNIIVMDNLKRRGSELNIPRLKDVGIPFVHGDIRNVEDFEGIGTIDLIIECSAEPSVLAGLETSPTYLINTNLSGTINCLEVARKNTSAFIFISTSRVYPIEQINNLKYTEGKTRYAISNNQKMPGASQAGITEDFPLTGARSLYGTTKLASELMLQEYIYNFGIKGIINRCGVITGPWQMGKVDQGVFVLWMARHIFGGKLAYIGYGGEGKQVRDLIHINDFFEMIDIEINDLDRLSGATFNIGGGTSNSLSLQELTVICENITGKKIEISSILNDRPSDVRSLIIDSTKFTKLTGWKPNMNTTETMIDIATWINKHSNALRPVLAL
ncbi:MAG: NAD-dependent epimerase/dehydratase family protein [Candidatus Roizmanbacteria bacterium]